MTYFSPSSPRSVGGRAWRCAVTSMTPSPDPGHRTPAGRRRSSSQALGREGADPQAPTKRGRLCSPEPRCLSARCATGRVLTGTRRLKGHPLHVPSFPSVLPLWPGVSGGQPQGHRRGPWAESTPDAGRRDCLRGESAGPHWNGDGHQAEDSERPFTVTPSTSRHLLRDEMQTKQRHHP